MTDAPLLDLFRSDVDAYGGRIEDNLVALTGDGVSADRLAAIARDARAIASAARILGIEPAIRLADALEGAAGAGVGGRAMFGPGEVDAMAAATTLLARIAAASAHLDGWMSKYGGLVDEAEARLGGSRVPPAEPAAAPEPARRPPPAPHREAEPRAPMALFRAEVDGQAGILGEGLLALEREPATSATLDALLRAAHSIKGAARIVELDVLVRLAHEMEACFVAAHEGHLALGGDAIDLLLHGVDRIRQIASVPDALLPSWLVEHGGVLEALIVYLAQIHEAGALAPGAPPERLALAAAPAPDGERVLRVGAENLSRIMALAGETVVESRWLDPFAASLLVLKRRQLELAEVIDHSRAIVVDGGSTEALAELLQDAQRKMLACQQALADRISDLGTFSHHSASLSARLYNEIISSRMRPFADGATDLPRLVRDLARSLGKKVRLEIAGEKTKVDRDVLDKLVAPLAHLVRNALDHGLESPSERAAAGKREEGTLRIEARHRAGVLSIAIADDGRGVDLDALRRRVVARGLSTGDIVARMSEAELLGFLFLPGFSLAGEVTELSGRGVGLDVVQTVVREVGGVVRANARPGRGMAVQLELPVTQSIMRTLLVEIGGEAYAFPLVRVDRIVRIAAAPVASLEGRQYFDFDGTNIGLVAAHQVLELTGGEPRDELLVVVVSDHRNRYGLVVDRFLGERDLVVQPLDPRLSKVRDIAATSTLQDGTPVLILDVDDLVRSIDAILDGTRLLQVARRLEAGRRKRILVIDDSITVREVERRLLEQRGYAVDVAVDGIDGWNAVRGGQYDLVITDVDMPRMTGLDLVARMRSDERLAATPVVIVSYKDRDADRQAGLGAGANRYLSKGNFQDDRLAEAIAELIGAAEP